MSLCWPHVCRLQVHTSHSNVGALSPLLSHSLSAQLAPFSSAAAPLQLNTACFPGCVQLLGNIIAVKTAAAAAGPADWAAGGKTNSGGEVATVNAGSFAASLLDSLYRGMAAADASGMGTAGARQLSAAEPLPAVDVVVGSATASTTAAAAAASVPAGPPPHVSLQWCSLACLAAGRQQQLMMHLQLAAPEGAAAAAGGSSCCRVVAFNSSGVLLDEQAELQQDLG
jgi:hypothetical protein